MINQIYKRLENETDEELIYRIGSEKNRIGTWDDVADILNDLLGFEYTESKYRKQFKGMQKVIENNQNYIEKPYDELSERTWSFQKERIKLQTEKLEYNRWLRENARDEMIVEQICNTIATLPRLEFPERIQPVHNNKSWLLCWGDPHYGVEFEIKNLWGSIINKYSPEIFEDRMFDLLEQVIEKIQKENIDELTIFELGDGIQGIIRLNSQLMKLRYGIIDSSIMYANYLANWLNELSKYVRIKFQMVTDSNHCQLRICNAPKNAFPEENMSKVMLTLIRERLKGNPNIVIIENPTGMNYAQMSTYSVLGIHGEVKDPKRAIDEIARAYETHLDYLITAHKHHLTIKETGIDSEVLGVRSIIGVDPYGMSLNATSNAGASMFEFEQGKGRVAEYCFKLN